MLSCSRRTSLNSFSGACKEAINYVATRWIEEASTVIDIMEDVGIAVAAADSSTVLPLSLLVAWHSENEKREENLANNTEFWRRILWIKWREEHCGGKMAGSQQPPATTTRQRGKCSDRVDNHEIRTLSHDTPTTHYLHGPVHVVVVGEK